MSESTPRKNLIELLIVTLAVGLSCYLLLWCLSLSNRGYEFSDEGFYLLSIDNPSVDKASVMQFGFVYNPLYRLLGSNIVSLRIFNIGAIFAASWLLSATLIRRITEDAPVSSLQLTVISSVFASCSLSFLLTWLPTPNYNALAYGALLLGISGLLLAGRETCSRSVFGWLLVGAAACLAFLAKPTSAALFVLIAGIHLLVSGHVRSQWVLLTAGLCGFCMCMVGGLIDGSPGQFITRFRVGAEDLRVMQDKYYLSSIFRWDWKFVYFSAAAKQWGWILGGLSFLGTLLAPLKWRSVRAFVLVLIGGEIGLGILLLARVWNIGVQPEPYINMLLAAPAVGGLIAAIIRAAIDRSPVNPRRQILAAVTLAAAPYMFAIGTNGNYWYAMSHAAFFWLLCAASVVLMVTPPAHLSLTLLALAGPMLLISIRLLVLATDQPYRQSEPLDAQNTSIRVGPHGSPIIVSAEAGRYIRELRAVAASAGFRERDPVIDLTGHYPGALYALGATAVARSWIIGGYPGSPALATRSLDRVGIDDLKRAWILLEPDGPRHLDPSILKKYGIEIERDYVEAGSLMSPEGAYKSRYNQRLLRPKL